MTIYEVNKLLSSGNKSKIIAHFWNCVCQNHDVGDLSIKLGIAQSNLSKHIGMLLKYQVLNVRKEGKQHYYSINQEFKQRWAKVIDPQIAHPTNHLFECDCLSEHLDK